MTKKGTMHIDVKNHLKDSSPEPKVIVQSIVIRWSTNFVLMVIVG